MSNGFGFNLFENFDPLTGKLLLEIKPRIEAQTLEIDGVQDKHQPLKLTNGISPLDTVGAENGRYIAGRRTKPAAGYGYSIESDVIQDKAPAFMFEYQTTGLPKEDIQYVSNYQLEMMNNCYSDGTPRYTAGQSDRDISDKQYREGIKTVQKLSNEVKRLKDAGFADNSPEIMERIVGIEEVNRILNPNYGVELLARRAEEKRAADEAKMHAETLTALNDLKAAMVAGGPAPLFLPPSPGGGSMGIGGLFGSSGTSTPTSAGSATGFSTPSVLGAPGAPVLSRKSPPAAKTPANNAELFKDLLVGILGKVNDADYINDGKKDVLPDVAAKSVLDKVYNKLTMMNFDKFTKDQEDDINKLIERVDVLQTELNDGTSTLSKDEVQKIQTEIFNLQTSITKKGSPKSLANPADEAKKLYPSIPKKYVDIVENDSKDGVKQSIKELGGIRAGAKSGLSVDDKWKSLLALILVDKGVKVSKADFENLYKSGLNPKGQPSKSYMTKALGVNGITVDWTDYGLTNPT